MRQYMSQYMNRYMLIGLCLIFTLGFFYFLSTSVEGLRGKNTMSQSINKQKQEKQQQKHQQQSLNKKHQQPLKRKLPRKKLKQPLKPPSIKPYSGIDNMSQSSNLNLNSI